IEKAYDTGWYSEGGNNFVISNAKEFFGLIYVSAMDSFENKTISLDADIELNTGFAGDWDKTPPENVWQPIGINIVPFKGTFDGNMHTVSGLYINTEARYNGLFGAVQDATIKNLKLKNSYIASADQWTGSFAGRGNGTFTNLYSNAIIVAGDAFEGGILGQADYGPVSMSNCWFDGSVTNTYSAGENSRGFVGGFIGYIPAVATVIEDCLFTGDIDISGMQVKTLAGASGFVGVMEGSHEMRNILMIGNIKAGESIGYYAHTGQGTPVGGVAYAVITAPNEEYTDWQGNYGGRPSEEFDYHELVRKASVGSLVKYTMPEFDWENTWLAVSGGHPVLQVFADEALPSAEWIDISWYDAEPYVLTDIGDLYGFQELVNSGVTFEGKTVSLGADIVVNPGSAGNFPANEPEYLWIPIGKENTPFKGTFDGGMHTISGIYLNSNARHSGLFGCVKDANIRNLKLKNSYIASGEQWTGGIAGRGNGNFTNLYSNAIVVAGNAFEGGILGQADYGPVSISNCWVAGTVVNTYSAGENSRGFVGGFVGFEGGFPVALQNCLFTGRIDISSLRVKVLSGASGFIGVSEATPTLKNVVMLGTIKAGGIIGYYAHIGHGTPAGSGAYAVLEAPDGNSTNWPGHYGGKPTDQFKYKAVSREGTIGSIARFTMPDLDWGKTWTTVSGNHPVLRVFANEVSSYPETIDVSWYDSNEEAFVLEDAADLMGLAKLVNGGETFEGKTVTLLGDIEFNTGSAADWAEEAPENAWTPIGKTGYPFKGTFDGQGHTISGLYASGADRVGLFGLTVGAAVKDLKITNSYFASSGQWIGSFVAQGSGTLINLYSDAILTTSGAMIGGIVGANDDANKQDLKLVSCWFDGKIACTHSSGTNSGAFMGGLIGHLGVGKNKINNCLVTGSIDVSSFVPSETGNMKTGGFIGVQNAEDGTTVTKSAFLGTFITGENAGKPGMYALAGDSSQRNMNGSDLYAMVDYNVIAGGYSSLNGGYSIVYTNLGVSTFPIGDDAKTRMPSLDWENVWQTRENELPSLRMIVGSGESPEPEPEPGEETEDTSWYDETETEFSISDAADLMGLAKLVNSGVTFEGKTVTLLGDIEFNTGSAADWAEEAPENAWTPIGKTGYPFKGTFDGQGHTISGLYASGADRVGLFGLTVGAAVK
ncbi:MAG: hypothetical protein IK088_05765, partial [Lachnospiraceae bacterium]|nr:hypothetical protein [Lachnospiraceae bacterium]